MTTPPFSYRWATSEETEVHSVTPIPGAIMVPLTEDSTGKPYTQGEADLAVPLATAVHTKGPFVNDHCVKCGEPEGNCEGHLLAVTSVQPAPLSEGSVQPAPLSEGARKYLRNLVEMDSDNGDVSPQILGEIEAMLLAPTTKPLVLVEIEDGVVEVSEYHYGIELIVIDYDDLRVDGEYFAARRQEVIDSTMPKESQDSVLDRIDQNWTPY